MTNEEMNKMFNKNINIAYKIANQYRINYPEEYEDIKQVALVGLWKSIQHYNPKWAITTIAYKTIYNDINYYLRSIKKHHDNDISIYTVLNEKDNDILTIEDLLPDNHDAIEAMLLDLDIEHAFNKLNLSKIEEDFLELKKKCLSQAEIGKKLNKSQAQISRIQTKIREKFKTQINENYKILKPKREEQKVIHKVWIDESNDQKQEIEFYCPETPEENENFCDRIDDMLQRIRLMNYFRRNPVRRSYF